MEPLICFRPSPMLLSRRVLQEKRNCSCPLSDFSELTMITRYKEMPQVGPARSTSWASAPSRYLHFIIGACHVGFPTIPSAIRFHAPDCPAHLDPCFDPAGLLAITPRPKRFSYVLTVPARKPFSSIPSTEPNPEPQLGFLFLRGTFLHIFRAFTIKSESHSPTT